MARQDRYPLGFSSSTITRIWDGTTIKLFGGKGELLTWVTYLNADTSDATNVMVKLSSFTGTGSAAGSGFSAVIVSSVNVWDYTQRPYSLYKYGYLQQIGMNNNGPWDPTEYEERHVPLRWRRPCTVNVNGDCVSNGGTAWTDRRDHDKFYPDIAVPMEEFAISSFTVAASSSQAIGGEVYVSTALPAGTYTATLTVTEGVSVSTTIPIQLLVYNFTLPGTATVPVIAMLGLSDLAVRFNGIRFPSSYYVDPYLTTELRAAAFLHRHKIIPIGDQASCCGAGTHDYPSLAYQKHIDGTAYTPTYGYGNGPGQAVGDSFYMIGTYGNWRTASWSTSTVAGATGYCTNVSSWTAYCTANNLSCALYTADDEATGAIMAARVNKLSTWSSTAPACAFSGHTLPFFQTGNLPGIVSSAPLVNFVASTNWLGYSSATWQTYETQYQTTGSTKAWGYNSNLPGTAGLFTIQEAGLGPREVMWGMYKTGLQGWFLWESNYWNDSNNSGQTANGYNANASNDNNIWVNSKTFGYDVYPTTNPVKFHTGFAFANGDGNILYPGTDTVNPGSSYGFNGLIGSWRLNMLTRGIQDVDYLSMAYAINPTATRALLNAIVQKANWEIQAFSLADPTYAYGDRTWSENADDYETTREALALIIANATPAPPAAPTIHMTIQGTMTIQGRVQVQ